MNQVLDFCRGNQLINSLNQHVFPFSSPRIPPSKACFHLRNRSAFRKKKCSGHLFSCPVSCKLVDQAEQSLVEEDAVSDGEQFTTFPHIQTLRNFPKEKLFRKVVMVRFDTMIILQGMKEHQSSPENAFSTIKYLYEAGAKVILVGSWSENANSRFSSEACPSTESVSDFLSSMLEVKIVPVKYGLRYTHSDVEVSKTSGILLLENLFYLKEERANCSKFSKELAAGVDIVVNDAFSESHKVLASTVGIASFCSENIAGFYFEECLHKLKKIMKTDKRPSVAIVLIYSLHFFSLFLLFFSFCFGMGSINLWIYLLKSSCILIIELQFYLQIGGGNLADKAAALRFLSFTCDGLIFVGSMAFHIMHALGVPVLMKLVEGGALKEAVSIVESAKSRNILLVIPKDIWCIKNDNPKQMHIFSVYSIPEGKSTTYQTSCLPLLFVYLFIFSLLQTTHQVS
ncbi:Phosphoglycerate kinase [Handroanthus impetiginosus]|uniref:Phosphoglycerate kinase n=1 Tax=Handroanthus impetiginosus TaxID=429701 RepID=A0A2G9GIU7_9LAMI|nr:Phosphoglycerate kinase [Handroanthus impetiginosus]